MSYVHTDNITLLVEELDTEYRLSLISIHTKICMYNGLIRYNLSTTDFQKASVFYTLLEQTPNKCFLMQD